MKGVLEPTFEGGQTVPVIASMLTSSGALTNFFWGVSSVFATGQAAFTMSKLYADGTPANLPTYNKVTLSREPATTVFGATVEYVKPGEVKPVVFGTDTTLGIKIKWSGQTAQYPSSANIGFKRTEGAFAPIAVGENPDNPKNPNDPKYDVNKKYVADVASLLATIETGVTAPPTTPTASAPTATFTYVQYFATGSAANELARQKEVRLAMLKKSDPSIDIAAAEKEAQAKKAEAGKAQWELNRELINEITWIFNNTSDENKTNILTKAQSLNLVGPSVTKENFVPNLKSLAGDASKKASLNDLKVYAGTLK